MECVVISGACLKPTTKLAADDAGKGKIHQNTKQLYIVKHAIFNISFNPIRNCIAWMDALWLHCTG